MSRIRMLWPVYGHAPRETLAYFFEWGDAVSFVNANLGTRNLYIGQPKYDTRPILELEAKPNKDGSWSVAA